MITGRLMYDGHVRAVALRLAERESVRMGFALDADEFFGLSRQPHVVAVRRRVAMLMHPLFSLPAIGRALSRDHTTIIHYIRCRERELAREHGEAA